MVSDWGPSYFSSHWADPRTVTENFQDTHTHAHTHVHVHTCPRGHRYADLGTASFIDASVSSRYYYYWLEVIRLSSSHSRDVSLIMEIHPNPWSDLTHAEPLLQPAGGTRVVVHITRLLGDSCSVKWQEKRGFSERELTAVTVRPYTRKDWNIGDGERNPKGSLSLPSGS